ncbi:MAG: precorrin-2 C(20)-methyltransferase [Acidimicrobiales bacterium]
MRKSSIYLPEETKSALSREAKRAGLSEAQLIRGALERALSQRSALQEQSGATRDLRASRTADGPVPGRLVGVGVGPGEPDLITVRAVEALRRADVVVAPSSAPDAVGRAEAIVRQVAPEVAVVRVAFDMSPSRLARDISIDKAAGVVCGFCEKGNEVAWITLGDPLVYSTFPSVAEAVKRLRPSTVVCQVPGIMAFQALAARTSTVVADERTKVTIRTALDGEDLGADLEDGDTTLVVYKGGRRLPEVAGIASILGRDHSAVAGELLGMPGEQLGTLADMAARGPASYLATVILPFTRVDTATVEGSAHHDRWEMR